MNTAPEYLFVYGTLMQGFDNDFAKKLHQFSTYKTNGSFPGMLYAVSWYPGAIYIPDAPKRVFGEIYELSAHANLLPELDEYEDVNEDEKLSLYLRQIVPVTLENGLVMNCWTYLYNQTVAGLEEVENGDFRNFS